MADVQILLVIGVLLLLAELVTGTFYLAALGTAFLFTAWVLWLWPLSWLGAVLVLLGSGLAAVYLAQHLRHRLQRGTSPVETDAGGRALVSSVRDGRLRVRYRDSEWDARLRGAAAEAVLKPGDALRVVRREGNVLIVQQGEDG